MCSSQSPSTFLIFLSHDSQNHVYRWQTVPVLIYSLGMGGTFDNTWEAFPSSLQTQSSVHAPGLQFRYPISPAYGAFASPHLKSYTLGL